MNRAVWRLAAALFLWSTAYNLTLPFLPLTAADHGATPLQVGLVQGVAYAGAALALIPAGWLADRQGRKVTLLIGWAVGAMGAVLLTFATTWQQMLPGGFLLLAGAGAMPALAALVAEASPEGDVRRAMSLVFTAAPLGLLVGSGAGGWIAENLGMHKLYFLAAGVTVLAMLVLWPLSERRRTEDVAPAGASGLSPTVKLLLIGLPAGAAYFLLALPAGFMTPYLRGVVGMSLTGAGITNAQLAVGQIAFSALFSVWPRTNNRAEIHLGPVKGLALGRGTLLALTVCLGANAAFGFLFPVGWLPGVILALLLRGALFSLQPLGMALVSEVTGTQSGLAGRFSFLALVMGLAAAAAPVVSGALYGAYPALPFVLAGLAAAGGAMILAGLRLLARPVTTPSPSSMRPTGTARQ